MMPLTDETHDLRSVVMPCCLFVFVASKSCMNCIDCAMFNTCVTLAQAGLVMGPHCLSICLSVLTNTLVGYFKFPNFLWNKPHLHIKGANLLKMRFIP